MLYLWEKWKKNDSLHKLNYLKEDYFDYPLASGRRALTEKQRTRIYNKELDRWKTSKMNNKLAFKSNKAFFAFIIPFIFRQL